MALRPGSFGLDSWSVLRPWSSLVQWFLVTLSSCRWRKRYQVPRTKHDQGTAIALGFFQAEAVTRLRPVFTVAREDLTDQEAEILRVFTIVAM